MTQQEIVNLLHRPEIELSVLQISRALRITRVSVRSALNSMYRHGEVEKTKRKEAVGPKILRINYWRKK